MSLQVEFGASRYRSGMLPPMARRWTGRGFHRRLAAGIWKAIKTSKETILRLRRSRTGHSSEASLVSTETRHRGRIDRL